MSPRLSRLRIAGFKSFAEPVSLDILPGLTGIVGPNGCGKSNVVEALRWAMGETSARSLRGGEMDDVIFAGTTARASRNLAEVTITLQPDGEGALPAPFEAETELQITRRIERGAGSQFRANGRELRARDVQTLYADLASGARSSGMVSQGRVSQLVNARPEDRRQVLEEAAGITGLHARRHEAELKLKAAEQNVLRAEDVRVQLEAAREALRKQARQSARYRNISGLIRAAEAEHLAVLHTQALQGLVQAEHALAAARAAAETAAAEVDVSGEALAEAEAAVPEPRAAEAQARSTLERRRVEAEQLAAESARIAEEAEAVAARLAELEADFCAAGRAHVDATESVQKLGQERERLEGRLASLPGELAAARAAHAAADAAAEQAQLAADQAALQAHETQANWRQAQQILAVARERLATMRAQHEAVLAEHEAASGARIGADRLAAADAALAGSEAALAASRAELEAAEAARAAAELFHLAARGAHEQALAQAQSAQRSLADAAAREAAFAQSEMEAAGALRALEARRVPPAQIAALAAEAERTETAVSLSEAEFHAAEHAAAAAQDFLGEAKRRAEDARAARVRAEATRAASALRAEGVSAEAARAEAEAAEAEQAAPSEAEMAGAAEAVRAAEDSLAVQEAALKRLLAGRAQAAMALDEARAALAVSEAEEARLAAEAEGLRAAIGAAGGSDGIWTELAVPEGLESAFGAALGEARDAGLDEGADRFFRTLPALDRTPADLPHSARFLDSLTSAPPALARLLGHIVLLGSPEDGDGVQAKLAPGMSAVTREGACWRWDGQVVRAGAPNGAAVRLRQANRLRAALTECVEAASGTDAARARCEAAGHDEATARAFEDEARAAFAASESFMRTARDMAAALSARAATAEARRATLLPALQRLVAAREVARAALRDAEHELRVLADGEDPEAVLDLAGRRAESCASALHEARLARAAARARLSDAQAALLRLREGAREAEARHAGQCELMERLNTDLAAARAARAEAEAGLAALPDVAALHGARQEAEQACSAAKLREGGARAARLLAEQRIEAARAKQADLHRASVQAESRLAALETVLSRSAEDVRQAEAALAEAEAKLADLPDQGVASACREAAQASLDQARKAASDALSRLKALEAELHQAEAASRVASLDCAAWTARLEEAMARETTLAGRVQAARAACAALQDAPGLIAVRAERSAEALAAAESAHRSAHERLQAAEQRARALSLARRDAELQVASRREVFLRTEAAWAAAQGAMAAVLARAAERLGSDAVPGEAEDASDEAEERARKKFERLGRERDEMGPVNLRAELELEELEQRLATLEAEREELNTAIAKLRGSIGHLNREGRARLEAVFQQVDQHFRTLFTRMMGGGRAHLALTGSDDPLLAGLEIYAEPPGKKLSALSLLSGGEQALTALSLIFAVFRCTPAPISVLDEVDAPLDDANVERFCALLDDVVRETGTRFLVVTHHQLTMSRMDRLFGVTMQERGVSRLLSVDLQRAAAMVEKQLQAAE
jgi:chromosome segregation protein